MDAAQEKSPAGGTAVAERPAVVTPSVPSTTPTEATSPEAIHRELASKVETSVKQALPTYNPTEGLIPATAETPMEVKDGLKEVGASAPLGEFGDVTGSVVGGAIGDVFGRNEEPMRQSTSTGFLEEMKERDAEKSGEGQTLEEEKKSAVDFVLEFLHLKKG